MIDAPSFSARREDPLSATIGERFDPIARPFSRNAAVSVTRGCQTRSIGSDELLRRSARAAGTLRRTIGDSDARVAVLVDNEIDQVVAAMAVYRAGCTAVPMQASNPPASLDRSRLRGWQQARVELQMGEEAVGGRERLNTLHTEAQRAFEPKPSRTPTTILATTWSAETQRRLWSRLSPCGLHTDEISRACSELCTPCNRKVAGRLLDEYVEAADPGVRCVRDLSIGLATILPDPCTPTRSDAPFSTSSPSATMSSGRLPR